jgi:hypothetical protein
MTQALDALPSRQTESHFAGEGNSRRRPVPFVLSPSPFPLRPAAYLGALRPQPPATDAFGVAAARFTLVQPDQTTMTPKVPLAVAGFEKLP